jgi:hypothetical protein
MEKLKQMLCAACALVLINISGGVANADSSNFAGPYVGVSASGYGMATDGTETESDASHNIIETQNANVGATTPITGFEGGYALPLGSSFLIDLGAAYMNGAATLSHVSDSVGGTSGTVKFTIDDLRSYYIAPTLVLSDTSSLYLKAGLSEADVTVTGDITSPGNLSGQTWALGTRTVLDSGIFVRTEAGYTKYNGISAHGKGTNIANTTSYSATPTLAYGAVSLGFRF